MNKREFLNLVAASAVAAPVAMLSACDDAQKNDSRETIYARVMRTGKIRCGYGLYAPLMYRDPNTDAFGGLYYEITERMGRLLGLQIEWTEETGWGALSIEGLRNNRFDIFASALWPNAERGRQIDFSVPFYYSGVGIYVRANDTRFDNDFSKINNREITISVQDGEMGGIIAASDYPQAKVLSLPALADFAQVPMNVATRKADVAFLDDFMAARFLEKNPDSLKCISSGEPIRVFENPYAFKRDEYEFVRMINIAITELHNNGEIEKVLRKYDGHATGFWRVARPYQIKV